MPQVPQYTPQATESALGTPYASAPSGDGGARAIAGGLNAVNQEVSKVQDQNNVDVAQRAEAAMKTDFVKFESELRAKAQGRDAVGYADTIKNWWDETGKKYGEGLNGQQQRMIGRSMMVARTQSYEGALRHETQERDRSELESFTATKLAEIQRAGASGSEAVAATSVQLLKERNAEWGAKKGLTPEVIAQIQLKDTTALHVNMISRLQQSDPTAAQDYFNRNKGEIDGTRHDEITGVLNKVVAVTDGENKAGEIWAASKPEFNKPVDRPALEEQIRKAYPNDPARQHAAMQSLRERVVAHNEAEKEANAGNVNKVMAVVAQNPYTSVAQLNRMPSFQALPGAQQAQVTASIESGLATRASRAAAVESRADAAESRKERALQRAGYAKFFELSNPTVLAGMTEAQIQAQLPVLGPAHTNHLLEKFRSTKNDPTKREQWAMDAEDFKHIANEMELKPYGAKTEQEKAALGELQFRVENVIGVATQSKGKPLTREEKMQVMRQEIARTVKLPTWFGLSDEDKPVITLTPEQAQEVKVPTGDRNQIIESLTKRGIKPTDGEIRRLYLRGRSRSADFISAPKDGE